jgi:DNA-binding NarL/FixJ family response regulator
MVLFRSIMQQASQPSGTPWGSDVGLSRREREIVELLRHRLTNKEIALRLNLSEQTVKNHVHHALRKVGASSRFSIVELCESIQLSAVTTDGIGIVPSAHNQRRAVD